MSATVMSATELGKQLGVSSQTVYRSVERGDIRAIRIGRRILIPKAEAERLLASSNGRPADETDQLVQTVVGLVLEWSKLAIEIRELTKRLTELLGELQ